MNTITINGNEIDANALISLLTGQQHQAPLMKDYAMNWFETFKKAKLRPRTQLGYQSNLTKHIIPFFGDMRVNEIKVSDVQAWYNTMSDLAKSTARQPSVILHQIFEAAKEDHLITENPTESDRLTLPSKATEREALTMVEIKDVIRQLPRLRPSDYLMMSLMIYTGERRGEVLGLRWEDVDFENNLISVERSVYFLSNQPYIGPTKSKAGERKIPLLPELKEALMKFRKDTGYIVGDGDKPLSERGYRYAFERISKKMELHGATAHVFRHTFLTMAVDSLDLKTLQTIAGHASHVTTMKYIHKRDEKIREAGTKLQGMYA